MNTSRRNRFADNFQLWSAQALVASLRGLFRVMEFFASDERQRKLVEYRKKMESMDRDRDAMLQEIDKNPREAMDQMAGFLSRHGDYDTQQNFNELQNKVRASREEGNDLKAIRTQAGENIEEAIEGFKQYIEAHPKSHSAYSYLGGTLCKAKDWEASIKAYQEAERLAGNEPISASMARLSIGNVLLEKGDLEDAIAQYRRIIEAVPPEQDSAIINAYLFLGNALNKQGKRREAHAAWKEVIKRDRTKILAAHVRELLKANP